MRRRLNSTTDHRPNGQIERPSSHPTGQVRKSKGRAGSAVLRRFSSIEVGFRLLGVRLRLVTNAL